MLVRVIGRDDFRDEALLKVEADGLPAISRGDHRRVEIGQQVYAIGYARDLPGAVMALVGSVDGIRPGDSVTYCGWSPKVSQLNGGPLVDVMGDVIGINTWDINRAQDTSGRGLSLALSIETLVELVPRLMAGEVRVLPTSTPRPTATPQPPATPGPTLELDNTTPTPEAQPTQDREPGPTGTPAPTPSLIPTPISAHPIGPHRLLL